MRTIRQKADSVAALLERVSPADVQKINRLALNAVNQLNALEEALDGLLDPEDMDTWAIIQETINARVAAQTIECSALYLALTLINKPEEAIGS